MFSIKYKICTKREELKHFTVDELNYDGIIEGYFQVSVGSFAHGEYLNDQKYEDYGSELLTDWFVQLVRAASGITKHNYVAVWNFETNDLWLEFERVNKKGIIVREIVFNGNDLVIYQKPKKREIRSEANEIVLLDDFLSEVASSSQKFLNELYQINPKFLKTDDALEIIDWLEEYKKSDEYGVAPI